MPSFKEMFELVIVRNWSKIGVGHNGGGRRILRNLLHVMQSDWSI